MRYPGRGEPAEDARAVQDGGGMMVRILLWLGVAAALLALAYLIGGAVFCLRLTDPHCGVHWAATIAFSMLAAVFGAACAWSLTRRKFTPRHDMKFWQLLSVMRDEHAAIRRLASRKRDWHFVAAWIDNYKDIVSSQDRAKLDFVLPVDFVRAALRKSRVRFYLSRAGILRSGRHAFWDRSLSALRAFDRFGGHAMEEALEYGSFSVAGN